MTKPILLGSEIYARTGRTSKHPLAWPKTAPTLEVIRNFAWFDPDSYVEASKIFPRRLRAFHDPGYVDAAYDAEARQRVSPEIRAKYGLGGGDNPIFPSVIERAATACGVALKAAELLAGGGVVHSPLGGAHHVHPARAAGFGYFNDLVLGILAMQDTGVKRIAYIDLDAHHGDGVEAAFAYDPNVLTLSIHEENCWPYSGTESDPSYGVYNFCVLAGFNDSEMSYLLDTAVCPIVDNFAPEAIVIQAGSDSLEDDLMMKLSLSNRAYFNAIEQLRHMAPRIWVTGGGGYNPWAVVRCWAGIWCVLNDRDPSAEPRCAIEQDIIENMRQWPTVSAPPDNWLSTLVDQERPGEVRESVKLTAKKLIPS
ncbi:acetoin utilization protein AcuC [Planktotalea sp.]|uniref:acetoin utilization protein AcuC n=1 Tax=Planktotalea sp. TaxID=2029877 RepID=UPI00329A0603